jgi:hypothetical protein
MKIVGVIGLVGLAGCATVQPFVPTPAQRARFAEVVREAEAAGATDWPPEAARRLANAKSDFTYAQHLPKYPERARAVAVHAEQDAEIALLLARRAGRSSPAAFRRTAARGTPGRD